MTPPTDEQDRLRALFTAPPDEDEAAPGCPVPDAIWQARSGILPPAARRDIIEHTAACAHCAALWRVAGDMGAAMPQAPRADRARRFVFPAMAAAAAVLVAAGLFVMRRQIGLPGSAGHDAMRAGGEIEIRALTPEDRPLLRADCVLAWTPGPEGTVYDVSVATPDLRVVARGRALKEARFQVPEEALRDLPAGASLVWKVEAQIPGGARAASPAFFVRLE